MNEPSAPTPPDATPVLHERPPEGVLSRALGRLEDACLVVLLLAMTGLAAGQILMRNAFETGFIWGDELLRILVLWIALGGAVAASRDDRHITIDVLSRTLPPLLQRVSGVVTALFTSAVCAVLAWQAWRFVRFTIEFEDTALGALPAWIFQVILPLGFALIALRYLAHAWRHLRGPRFGPAARDAVAGGDAP